MQFVVTFLEGMITFVSPCVLPMIPVYVLYFSGGKEDEAKANSLVRALCFVAGFTALFVALGLLSGTLGGLLIRYQQAINIVCGLVIIAFGLHYAGIIRIKPLEATLKPDVQMKTGGCGACFLLGLVFAIGWSPCTGPFLGSAMMMAAAQGHAAYGAVLLLCYALGMGVPFALCALLIDQLKQAFTWIKRHYAVINKVCGVFLILVGILMMTGMLARLSAL